MRLCSFLRDSKHHPLQPNFELPAMDLSSLEGPQMVNPKFIVQPDVPARIHHSRTPTHVLFSKPLPPRPASADATSPRHGQSIQQDWPSERMMDGNLRRSPARRRSPQYEGFYEYDPRSQHVPTLRIPQQYPSGHHVRRPRSCNPTNLIWLEDQKLWVVGNSIASPQDRFYERPPSHSTSPVSPLSGYHPMSFHRNEYDLHYSARADSPDHLPVHNDHGFGPPHIAQTRDDRVSRWMSVVERTHANRRG
ncbi:unnamed protein product [Penicillium olsonii]|nr:unnamed protein product [Penicillium olsonii]